MNIFKIYWIYLICLLINCSLAAMGTKIHLNQARLPALSSHEIKMRMDKHIHLFLDKYFKSQQIIMCGMHPISNVPRVFPVEWLPGCIIKMEEFPGSRMQGAKRLMRSIVAKNSNLLEVPYLQNYVIPEHIKKQILYAIPKGLVIQGKIPGSHVGGITLAQAKQLKETIQDTGYADVHQGNLIYTDEGTVGLIDTELRGFVHPDCALRQGLKLLLDSCFLEKEAKEYLKQEYDASKALKK